jgi:hypothetical protein
MSQPSYIVNQTAGFSVFHLKEHLRLDRRDMDLWFQCSLCSSNITQSSLQLQPPRPRRHGEAEKAKQILSNLHFALDEQSLYLRPLFDKNAVKPASACPERVNATAIERTHARFRAQTVIECHHRIAPLPIALCYTLQLVLLLDGVRVAASLGSVDELLSKALCNRLDVSE